MNIVTFETLFNIFFCFIGIDFISAILASGKQGGLESRPCSTGLFRSAGECILLYVFLILHKYLPSLNIILGMLLVGFIFKETLSIIENLIKLDVWIPDSIKKMFVVGVDKINKMDIKKFDGEEK